MNNVRHMGQFDGFPFFNMLSDVTMAKKYKNLEQDLVIDGLVFEVVQNCRCLSTFINLKN